VTRQQCLYFNIHNQCNVLACDCNIYNGWTNFRSLQHQHKEKSSYQFMSTNSFRGTAPQCVDLNPLDFYLRGHLKTLVYSAPIENEQTFHQCLTDVFKPFTTSPGPPEVCKGSMFRHVHQHNDSCRHFEHFLYTMT